VPDPLFESATVRVKATRYGTLAYARHDLYIGRSLDLYGEWSELACGQLGAFLQPDDVVCDVGANIGVQTIALARAVPQGAVYAFEPIRANYQLLVTNCTLNDVVRAIPVHAAVGAASGHINVPGIDLHVPANFGSVVLDSGGTGGEEIPLVTLDALGLPRCALVKIDVEGMESAVLRGAVATLERCRPTIFIENDRDDRSGALLEQLIDLGYDCYWLLTTFYNPDNFFGEHENVFGDLVETNMVCVHRARGIALAGLEKAERGDSSGPALQRWLAAGRSRRT
jgi:FkbM family methyltransferase